MRALIVLCCLAGSLAAQETTGKLQGTIRSPDSLPLASAQVFIVGTAFGTYTDRDGYYFFNNMPVGVYALQAQLIGYAPALVTGVRVLGGQTQDVNVMLTPAAVTVTGVAVSAATNPLVPRDQMTSKRIIAGDLVDQLPVSSTLDIVTLQPGVVVTGGQDAFSIRGSRPGETQVFIDGAPVRPVASVNFGINYSWAAVGNAGDRQMPTVSTNALQEATVTTGSLAAEQGNAQAGAVSYTTRVGGERVSGSFAYETDEPFADAISQGLSRFEASLGGAVPGVSRLRYFVSGSLQGLRSSGVGLGINAGAGWDRVATFVSGGTDTVVSWIEGDSARSAVIPQFVQVTGPCGTLGSNATPVTREIRANYGVGCQGGRLPMNWQTDAQFQGKLLYSYGLGSTVSLTALANGMQRRYWPGTVILDPALFQGQHGWSRAVILNLSHQLFRKAERALSVNLNASWQVDNLLAGQIDSTYETRSRSPGLGIVLSSMRFAGLDNIQYPLTEAGMLRAIAGQLRLTPYGHRDDLHDIQPFRLNPMGMAGGGWFTQGMDQDAQMHWERRLTSQLTVDWQVDRFNRLTLGAEGRWNTVSHWEAGSVVDPFLGVFYRESPALVAGYASDRLDLGDFVVDVGLRWDSFNTNGRFPTFPGRLYIRPAIDTSLDSIAAGYARATYPSARHSALSPRIRVSFPITEWTDIRLSLAKQVAEPEFYFTFGNNDVSFGQTILYEIGVRHALTPGTVLDVAIYNKDIRSELTFRSVKFDDPGNPGTTVLKGLPLNLDFGYVRGVDLTLDLRLGAGFQGTLGYGYQTSRSTGSDPFTVLRQTIEQVTGDSVAPAQALTVTDFDRTHNLSATLVWSVPDGSGTARLFGGALRRVSLFATARYMSGLPYTSLVINDSRLPAHRVVDARLTKALALGRVAATAYLDVRNVFNFLNVSRVVLNRGRRSGFIASQQLALFGEASVYHALVDTTIMVDVSRCSASQLPAVDCVALNRAEARYGDGDGLFTEAEQARAFGAYYDMTQGSQWRYGPPQRVRIGLELRF